MTSHDSLPPARYDGFADWYDENLAPSIEAAGRDLLALLSPGPGRCVDIGCGTGVNLQRLADAGWLVVGVDLSADQLRRARTRAPAGVELVQADATALPFADACFAAPDDDFPSRIGILAER